MISELLEDLELQLLVVSTQKGAIHKAQKIKIEALKNYLEASNVDLAQYLEIDNYLRLVSITKPKDKIATTQTKIGRET